jgi:PAS domain S-box-containing protein
MEIPILMLSHELKAFFEQIPLGLLLVDEKGRIAEVNRTGEVMFDYSPRELIGQSVEVLIPDRLRGTHATLRRDFSDDPRVRPMGVGLDLIAVKRDGTEFFVEIALGPAEVAGTPFVLCCVTDISVRKRLLDEKEKILADLHHALAEVRRLSGLLPICAFCKKIRDEEGRWWAVEEYVVDHSEAKFSHGLCPDCRERLYPDVFAKE